MKIQPRHAALLAVGLLLAVAVASVLVNPLPPPASAPLAGIIATGSAPAIGAAQIRWGVPSVTATQWIVSPSPFPFSPRRIGDFDPRTDAHPMRPASLDLIDFRPQPDIDLKLDGKK